MWYYVQADHVHSSSLARSLLENYKYSEQLVFDLEKRNMLVIPEYSDTCWVRTSTDREYTVLALLTIKYHCSIKHSLSNEQMLQEGIVHRLCPEQEEQP